MPNLIPKPDRCLGCPLYDAPGMVGGHGPENAKIVIVGEAPGTDEVTVSGRPFTGGSGRVLNALLHQAGGIKRADCYATNVVKCRPTDVHPVTGDVKDRPPTKEEIEWCRPFLDAELEGVKPNLILALGATALYFFKDRNEITKYRGQCFADSKGRKVLPTFHPAGLMRQQKLFPLVVEDLKRAAKEQETPTINRLEVGYTVYGPGGGDPDAVFERAVEAGFVTEDLETYYPGDINVEYRANCSILCNGFGTRAQFAESYAWTPQVAELTKRLHTDPRIEVVTQNGAEFDLEVLYGKGIPYPARHWDTKLASHLLDPDVPKDLATLGSRHTDREYWKDKGRKAKSLTETQEYNCEDIDGTTRSYLAQRKDIKALGLEELYYGSVMPLQPVLRAMTRRGVKKDVDKAAIWSMMLRKVADQKLETLRSGLGVPWFNPNSPKQLMQLFYEDLKLPIQYKRDKTGTKPTANREAIEALALITDNPIFHLVYEIRSALKLASTYCDVEVDEDDYMHGEFSSAKAANGRLNSFNPNMQNIPNEMREIIIADSPDHVIVSADWSQVEWRVAMVLCACKLGLEIFTKGLDIHKMAATGFAGVPYDQVTKDQRHAMKFVVYGLAYGRQAASIAKQTGKDKAEVEQQIRGFMRTFPEYENWIKLLDGLVSKQSYLRNPFARRRWWYSRQMTEVMNFLPSSTPADMMYLVLPQLERELPEGASLRLTVHDEVDVVTLKESKTLKQTVECIRDVMQQKWPQVVEASLYPEIVKQYYPNGWYVPADISFGNNWKQCKPSGKDEKAMIEWQKGFQKELGVEGM